MPPLITKRRGPYRPACDVCSKRKGRCNGEPGSLCAPCKNSGRSSLCKWEAYYNRRNRGEGLVIEPPRRNDAVHKLLLQYVEHSSRVETVLGYLLETHSLSLPENLNLERPRDPDGLLGLSLSLGDMQLDKEAFDVVEVDDSDNLKPFNILLWNDQCSLVECYYGLSSPFRFRSDPLPFPSRFPAIAEDPDLTYVLLLGNAAPGPIYNPHFDWARYLPSAVALDRGSHDRALDVLFRFCTSFCLRIIPDLFLKGMYRVLTVNRSQEPPKSVHYSPMLHNALVGLALAFSDDPTFRDLKARQYFIDAAKDYMESECRKPTLATVQALSFLGTFYGSQGDQGLGFMYFGLAARLAQALAVSIDCTEYVRQGLMDHSDKVDRNWLTWSIFTADVCWSLYVGREFATSVPDDDFPLPYIDTALDAMEVSYGNLEPQPNETTKTFHANAELFVVGRNILEVNDTLTKSNARPTAVFDKVYYVNSKLNDWLASLPPDLQLTAKSRATATPHKLILHLSYWWLLLLLHRPLFHTGASKKGGEQIDHVKLCKRAADNIMDILKTWHELFSLRFSSITLIQIAFSAGTVYVMLAVQACTGVRIAKKELEHDLFQKNLVFEYLHEIGRTWPGANKVAEILRDLVQKKLTPLLEKIPVRSDDIEPGMKDDEVPVMVSRSPSSDRMRNNIRSPQKKRKASSHVRGRSGTHASSISQSAASSSTVVPSKQLPPVAVFPHDTESRLSGYVVVSSPDAVSNPEVPDPFQIPPPQPLFYPSSQLEEEAGHVEPPDSQFIPSTWPSAYSNAAFQGMAQGQSVAQEPFWWYINVEQTAPANQGEFVEGSSSFNIPSTSTGHLHDVMDTDDSITDYRSLTRSINEFLSLPK